MLNNPAKISNMAAVKKQKHLSSSFVIERKHYYTLECDILKVIILLSRARTVQLAKP